MDDGPAASVDVLVSHTLGVAVELEFDEARRQHVQGGGVAVLHNQDRV